MKLYRFSPINTQEELLKAIRHIHKESSRLCMRSFGRHLPNAGNMGVFCHYDDEYAYLTSIRESLTEASDNVNQKYFRLHRPIIIPADKELPETIYSYLYIRKPDPYRHHVGDVDYYLDPAEYQKVKTKVIQGSGPPGTRVFERTDLDMIELYDPDVDVLAYVSTTKMVEHVRVKHSSTTLA